MQILFKLSSVFASIHKFSKFFVVLSDVASYASQKFEEAYPQSERPQPKIKNQENE